MMTEVERVLNALRIQKALKRKERLDRAKLERPLVLSEKEKDQMIACNKAATQEGRDDCAEWMKLKETHQRHITPLTPAPDPDPDPDPAPDPAAVSHPLPVALPWVPCPPFLVLFICLTMRGVHGITFEVGMSYHMETAAPRSPRGANAISLATTTVLGLLG